MFAFEFYRAHQNLEALESINDTNLSAAFDLFQELDSLEANLYGQIVQQRIAVIRTLQERVEENAKEKVIQEYIYDHLWLLDPAWERAEATEYMERRVGKLFEEVSASLNEGERLARLDIGYRETAGKHVIVELKRPGRSISVFELSAQINKYRSGMKKFLQDLGRPHEPVEFVCLLGQRQSEWNDDPKLVENNLETVSARIKLYEELLEHAFRAYKDYLDSRKFVDRLQEVIKAIDDYESENGT
ncbi:hypothetical protein [Nitrosococcus wardiae]|uniref:Uncharacterized protein n=1 Tax=Nitrosococcus wardiae TaxID=1814290 RepID=A0A4P7BXP5_9GAMM|nr:hypothetical protein [Nitrosococcus wardiae]QBQ54938.1 hypothetical protein E3U44_10725 [Nitrosococcus wardiae]